MKSSISTRELKEFYSDQKHTILDCRPSAAYNGWPLLNEPRGGHVPAAVSFPAEWFRQLGNDGARKTLQDKGIKLDKPLIITTYDLQQSKAAADQLRQIGFTSIQVHTGGMLEWLADSQAPVQFLAHYKHLVHPGWLRIVLEGKNPEPGKIKKTVLAHVNFDNWGDYDCGHIPGSIWLDTLILEDEMTWNHRTPDEMEAELRAHGIDRDTTVILYGRTSDPNMSQAHPGKQAGQLSSMRAALLLMYAGIEDVRVLDGGLDAWLRAGGSVTRKETLPTPAQQSGLEIPEHPEYIVDTPKAKEMIKSPNAELVSVRSYAEFIGEVSGYHYIDKKGRIPGAVFGNCGSDAYHMENYRNHDDTMRSFHEIQQEWAQSGLTSDKHIAFYCGTGWRASEAFYCAWLMGWKRVSIYDGGWYEWSSNPDNPVESGTI